MAVTVNVAGLATIKVGTGAAQALETLGYTRNGAQITTEGHYVEVKGDERGGDDGPPVEIQQMGETARVRLEFTKWDTAVADKVAARLRAGTVGSPYATYSAGATVFGTEPSGTAKYYRLLVHSPTTPFNFPCAVPRHAIEINKGTKHSTFMVEFECYPDPTTNVLYNSSTT